MKTRFLTFNDGIIRLYRTDEDDNIIPDSVRKSFYGNNVVGIKRYYAARENDIELDKVVRIPYYAEASSDMAAVIGSTRYKIEQIQQKQDTAPPSTVLSLSQRGLYEGEQDEL